MSSNVGTLKIRILSFSYLFPVLVILLSGLVDVPALLIFNSFSVLAVLSIMYCSVAWLLWIKKPLVYNFKYLWPMLAFALWVLFSLIWFLPTTQGIQNVIVYLTFVGLLLLVSRETFRNNNYQYYVKRALRRAAILSTTIYGTSIVVEGVGNRAFMGPRLYSLFALIGLSLFLAEWRYGPRTKIGFWLSLIVVTVITLSLSRTATVIGFVLIVISKFKPSVWGATRTILISSIMVVTLYSLINYFEPLKNRFFEGDTSLNVGGLEINAMGRTAIWNTTIDSFKENILTGKGPGSSEEVIKETYITISHPHNDYLRILHDYGLIGASFWILGLISLLVHSYKRWVNAEEEDNQNAKIHLATFLSLISVMLSSLTDNSIVYVFVMAPLAILTGLSLGLSKDKSTSFSG